MKKRIFMTVIFFISIFVYGQKRNWQNMDLKTDSVFGISTEKAYRDLLKDKKAESIIVAIIDSGIDTAQEDLKPVLWTNPKNNAHGKNYMGFEKGKEDVTNLASFKKDFYDSLSYTKVPETYRAAYQDFRHRTKEYEGHVDDMKQFIYKLKESKKNLDNILISMNVVDPVLEDFKKYNPKNEIEKFLLKQIINKLPHYPDFSALIKHELDDPLKFGEYHLQHGLSMENSDNEIGYLKINDSNNVCNDALCLVPDPNYTPYHGTHVAGIIGAVRNNGVGVDGVADHVQIMMLKVLNNVRELRDENLADAIIFAVNNGAKIINLSFGKPYTWDKKSVDDAVQYAMKKDVLIIHASGNAGNDLDQLEHYPNPNYEQGKGHADAWLEVGASNSADDSTLVAPFSNYGKLSVDVFAPGVGIYSTLPFNQYQYFDGTSMAAPVVAGLAALIREYHPKMTAVQVKEIIMRSVVKINYNVVVKKNNGETHSIPFADVCVSGGIVNAYNALTMAEEIEKGLQNQKKN